MLALPITVTGIASRRVVDYSLADHLRTDLIADLRPSSATAVRGHPLDLDGLSCQVKLPLLSTIYALPCR
jgi:hypothetical protein